MPKVSVIIPTYNRAHLVGRAIQSILNQTYRDFELIIVDDGSTDNTEEVVRDFSDERLRYLRHEKNKGAAAARNTGIRAASCPYIAFQDSDDEWMPDKLEKQMRAFETAPGEVGVIYTIFERIKDGKKTYIPSPKIRPRSGNIHKIILEGNFVGTPVAVVKKECFERMGMFDEKIPAFEDWELWIRISKLYQFSFIDEPLVISYRTPHSVNEQGIITQVPALKSILEKNFEDLKKDRNVLARHYFRIGNLLCASKDISQGRPYIVQAISAYPWNVKYILAALLSLLGQRCYRIVTDINIRIHRWQ